MSRRKSRAHAVQILFAIEMNETSVEEMIDHEIFETTGDKMFTQSLVEGVLSHQEEIDTYIRKHMEGWELLRIGRVERAILRLSIYEWLILKETDKNIVFNEAIEVAKIFGDEKTAKFINGVLSKIA